MAVTKSTRQYGRGKSKVQQNLQSTKACKTKVWQDPIWSSVHMARSWNEDSHRSGGASQELVKQAF